MGRARPICITVETKSNSHAASKKPEVQHTSRWEILSPKKPASRAEIICNSTRNCATRGGSLDGKSVESHATSARL